MATIEIDGEPVAIDSGTLSIGDCCTIEDVFGATFGEWATASSNGSIKAVRCLLLVLAQRSKPTLRMADIDALGIEALTAIAASRKGAASDDAATGVPPVDPTLAASAPRSTKSSSPRRRTSA